MERRAACILLAAGLLAACAARPAGPAAAPSPSPAPVSTPAPTPAPVTAWAEMEYESIDLAAFTAGTETLTALAAGDDAAALCACYDELYGQYTQAYTMVALAEVYSDLDVTDAVWAERRSDSTETLVTAANALAGAARAAMQGPLAAAFAEHIGADAAAFLSGYEPMTGRELELAARRSELAAEYYACMAEQDSVGAQAMAERVGPIYRELLAVCDEQARLRGCADFGAYAYAEEYCRDYAPAQIRALFAELKAALAKSRYAPARSPVLDRRGTVTPLYSDPDEMMQALDTLTRGLDPMFGRQFDYLTENGLYDIGSGPERADVSLTAPLPAFGNGQFILITLDGTTDDLSALVHEFGHCTALRTAPCSNYLTAADAFDLAEVPSTALELLAMRGYGGVYDAGADIARFSTLKRAFDMLVSHALYAEFELEMFADPDKSVDEISRAYGRLLAEYGLGSGGADYGWIYVPHFFSGPGYVASYAAATLASLQVWAAAEEDFDTGMDIYRAIVRAGSYDREYSKVLEDAGLQSFIAAPGTAAEVFQKTLDALQELENDILTADAPAA